MIWVSVEMGWAGREWQRHTGLGRLQLPQIRRRGGESMSSASMFNSPVKDRFFFIQYCNLGEVKTTPCTHIHFLIFIPIFPSEEKYINQQKSKQVGESGERR